MLNWQAHTATPSFYLSAGELNLGPWTCKASGLTYCTISPVHKHNSFDIKWIIGFYDLDYWKLIASEPHFLPIIRGLESEAEVFPSE